MSSPLAYFLTFSTYGTWLHGRAPGSVDRGHNEVGTPYLPADPELEAKERRALAESPYLLDAKRRAIVLDTVREVASHRGWRVWAVHVRSNHVHAVVTGEATPEKMMIDFKAYASRRLKERLAEPSGRTRWTQHGSTLYLWTEAEVVAKIDYVLHGQGEPLAVYDGRSASSVSSEPEASATEKNRR